jgi:phosphohistidine phosphatase SixA
LIGEPRDVMGVGHMPNLPRVLGLLTTGSPDAPASFPAHGIVALERATADTDGLWIERWRIESPIQTDEHRLSM